MLFTSFQQQKTAIRAFLLSKSIKTDTIKSRSKAKQKKKEIMSGGKQKMTKKY